MKIKAFLFAFLSLFSYLCRAIQNPNTPMKSAYKYELAEAAGVNYKTFQRWMANNRTILSRFGVRRNSKMLPPRAVQWICLQYGIDF
jgi:hypothetical protein